MTDTGTRAGRVLGTVRQLRQGNGDEPLQPGEVTHATADWPASVLGRCVVLRAHEVAGRRALRPIVAADPPTVRLWRRALDDVLSWPAAALEQWLLEPRQLTLSCGGDRHELVLAGEVLVARSHGALDVEAERTAAALGGWVPDCVRCVLMWEQGEPPRAEAARAAGPLSVLRWLQVVRAWQSLGYSPLASHDAVAAGLPPAALERHLQAGLSLPAAVAWSAWAPANVLRWQALRATPEDAAVWLLRARPVGQAEQGVALLRASGVDEQAAVQRLTEWLRRVGPRVPASDLAAWAASPLPATHWGELAARGISYPQAMEWSRHGFGPAGILAWSHLRIGVAEAVAWQRDGYGPGDAARLVAAGLPRHVARDLRDLPLATVLQLWPQTRDAQRLRQELDRLEVPA